MLRKHVFPLFVLTAVFVALYVAYKVVGDPLLQLIKVGRNPETVFDRVLEASCLFCATGGARCFCERSRAKNEGVS